MARKRGSGEGSIYKTPTGWRGQIFLGDKRASFSGKTKAEVVEKIAAARTDYNRNNYVFDSEITVKEWVELWLETRIKNTISQQSYIRYKATFANHVYPNFGDVKLQDLSVAFLEQKYAEIFDGNKYARSTVNHVAVQMKKCLQYAVEKNILAKNPHIGVQLHKLREPKKIKAHSVQDQKKIVQYIKDNGRHFWIFYLLLYTGIRYGEMAVLTWDDVDFKNKTITINKTLVEIHGSPTVQNKPKTNAGNRTISILPQVVDFLKKIKKELDPELNYRNLVIPNTRYGIMGTANSLRRWNRACLEMGIESNGIHALRHTWATRALESGVDVKTVSAMLGHKNIITTMNIYQDVLKEHQDNAIKKLGDVFE